MNTIIFLYKLCLNMIYILIAIIIQSFCRKNMYEYVNIYLLSCIFLILIMFYFVTRKNNIKILMQSYAIASHEQHNKLYEIFGAT